MIDNWMIRRSARVYAADNEPGRVPASEEMHQLPEVINAAGKHFVAIFEPWNGGGRAIGMLASRLVRRGYAVQKVRMHRGILNPDATRVTNSFRRTCDNLAERLQAANIKDRYDSRLAIGLSLGNVAMSMAAEQCDDFERFNMVVPGASLAGSLWLGARTQQLRQDMESNGMTLARLEDEWAGLAPANNTAGFKDKPVRFLVSTSDEVIPTYQQLQLRDALLRAKADVETDYTRVGHYMAVGQACLSYCR